jgi:hypothetical protein
MTTDIPTPVTIAELEASTGFGPRTVRRLVREGQLPGRIIGRRLLLTRGEFQQFLDGNWKPLQPIVTMKRRNVRDRGAA